MRIVKQYIIIILLCTSVTGFSQNWQPLNGSLCEGYANALWAHDQNSIMGHDLLTFCQYQLLLMHLHNRPGVYYSLTPQELSEFQTIAGGTSSSAPSAKGILEWVGQNPEYLLGYEISQQGRMKENGNEQTTEAPVLGELLNVYPNPFTDEINMLAQFNDTEAKVEIYNYSGQLIKTVKIISNQTIKVSMTDLSNGIYLFHFIGNNGSIETKKVILSK